MERENNQTSVFVNEFDEAPKKDLEQLSVLLGNEMENISERRTEGEEKIEEPVLRGIALVVNDTIERVRRSKSSPEMNQAFKKVSSIILKNEGVNMFLELKQINELFVEDLKNSTDEKKRKMLNEVLEGMKNEFDIDKEESERNNPVAMATIARKLFLDIAKIRDLNLSSNLIGIEGRASYLRGRSSNLKIDDVEIEVYRILLGLKKELRELAEKEVNSN